MSITVIHPPLPAASDPSWQHHFVDVNGVRLHYTQAGSGPLVVLLHGFPEFWYAWRRQISRLVAAGYRVIAPDLRGYNLSTKPRSIAAYHLSVLADDVRALITSAGAQRAAVVGHDWGAVVAWATAMRHPGCVERLAVLNGPHPVRMLQSLSNPQQLRRSLYILFFQLPWLPEFVLRRDGWKALFEALEHAQATSRWSAAERDSYRTAFDAPGGIRAMLNYYRALLRPSLPLRPRRVDAPVLVLWGERDPYLGRALAQPGPTWAPRARVEYMAGLGHFIQHEAPGRVSDLLIAFLNEGGARDRASTSVVPPPSVTARVERR